jgi:3-deoxy-7-phosphoheptulonate synthase
MVEVSQKWLEQFADSPLALKSASQMETIIRIHNRECGIDFEIGGGEFIIMAGPCSVENEEQLFTTAEHVCRNGAQILRGGAFKPRSSPYAFQGLGLAGLKLLAKARRRTGLAIVTEVMAEEDLELVAEYADILQIGSRNSENTSLHAAAALTGKPILLKRGMVATVADLLQAAHTILDHGNPNVILCERGIRTFETATRNTFDVTAIPLIKQISHLPIIADPSHAAGRRSLVAPLARTGIAAGADGLIVEVHPNPDRAWSDGDQSLNFDEYTCMIAELDPWLTARRLTLMQDAEALA